MQEPYQARLSLIPGGAPRHLTREDVLNSQRGRLMEAMATLVAEKGYAATTIGEVVAHAATSRRTFYLHFQDKEGCFLAAYDAAIQVLVSQMSAAAAGEGDWLQICRSVMRTYLGLLASEPAFARAFIIEITAAGPDALARRTAAHDQLVAFLQALHHVARQQDPRLGELPLSAYQTLVGGINDLIWRAIDDQRATQLGERVDEILQIIHATYLGAAEAQRERQTRTTILNRAVTHD
jgi:AcrR family transcriptional regulator